MLIFKLLEVTEVCKKKG